MSLRIYTVKIKKVNLDTDTTEILVKATSQSQALRHVTRQIVTEVAVSTQDEIVNLVSSGAKVEDATAETGE